MRNIVRENRATDYVLVFGGVFLFLMVLLQPVLPLLNKYFFTASGFRLFVISLEIFFSAFLYQFTNSGKYHPRLPERRLVWLLLLWLAWSLAAALQSQHVAVSLFRSAELIVSVVFLYSVLLFVGRYHEFTLGLRSVFLVGFVVYSIFLLTGWILYETWESDLDYLRIFYGFGHIRHFGYYSTIALVVSLGLLWRALYKQQVLSSILCWVTAAVACTWLFFLGGRGPFFAVLTALAITAVVNKGYFTKPFIVASLSSLVVGLLVSIPLSPEGFGPLRLVNMITQSQSLDEYSSFRLSIWYDSFALALQHPLFGVGPDGYMFELVQKYPTTTHPHGIFPQAVLEWGIPGALLFFIMTTIAVVKISLKVSQLRGDQRDTVGVYWAVLSIAIFSTIDGVLYHPRSVMIFMILFAVLLAELENYKQCALTGRGYRLFVGLSLLFSVIVTALHGNSFIAAASGPASSMDEQRVNNIRMFPSVMSDITVVNTVAAWSKEWWGSTAPERLIEWYRWAENHSVRPWVFAYLHAELLYQNGRYQEATEIISTYEARSPEEFNDNFRCLRDRYSSFNDTTQSLSM